MIRRLLRNQKAAFWYVALVIFLPLFTLVLLGLFTLLKNEWLLNVSLAWLACTLAGYTAYRLLPSVNEHKDIDSSILYSDKPIDSNNRGAESIDSGGIQGKPMDELLPARIDIRTDWDASENHIWHQALHSIETLLEPAPDWQELPDLCLHMISLVAYGYNNKGQSELDFKRSGKLSDSGTIYTFTLPELLLVLSITSSRYRQLLLNHVPFVDKIKISSLLSLYEKKDTLRTSAKWVNTARRAARFVNPIAAIAAELKDHFTGQLFSNVSEKMQLDLKRMLLQELVQVSMDLYSGRLKSTSEEMMQFTSSAYYQDKRNAAVAIEPLRIVLIGQTSSGKSSLVNRIKRQLLADSDILPSTDKTTVYSLTLDDLDTDNFRGDSSSEKITHDTTSQTPALLYLVDTVGLTEEEKTLDGLVAESLNADLLIWVSRANQPARAPDAALYKKLEQSLAEQIRRLDLPTMLVLTHIDQLNPKALWQPPYDLNSDDKKASNIRHALNSCKHQIGLSDDTPSVPVCLSDQRGHYNIDLVLAQIMAMQPASIQAQLNRRRLERENNGRSWSDRWEQARKLGVVSGTLISRSILNR